MSVACTVASGACSMRIYCCTCCKYRALTCLIAVLGGVAAGGRGLAGAVGADAAAAVPGGSTPPPDGACREALAAAAVHVCLPAVPDLVEALWRLLALAAGTTGAEAVVVGQAVARRQALRARGATAVDCVCVCVGGGGGAVHAHHVTASQRSHPGVWREAAHACVTTHHPSRRRSSPCLSSSARLRLWRCKNEHMQARVRQASGTRVEASIKLPDRGAAAASKQPHSCFCTLAPKPQKLLQLTTRAS
jgi:hypothetical protein